jgi:peroxiredoxin
MKKLFACAVLLSLALGAAARATSPVTDDNNATAPVVIGGTVADFKLPGADGREVALSLAKGARGTVIIFVSTQCPVSNAYNARMEKLAQDLRARGVNVIGINSNVAETPDQMRQHASEHKLSFTLLKDAGNKIADRFGATVTPEAFLLDSANKLVYRGRIDNSRNGDAITSEDLRNAVDETIAGKPVSKSEVRAFGCSIKRG